MLWFCSVVAAAVLWFLFGLLGLGKIIAAVLAVLIVGVVLVVKYLAIPAADALVNGDNMFK